MKVVVTEGTNSKEEECERRGGLSARCGGNGTFWLGSNSALKSFVC